MTTYHNMPSTELDILMIIIFTSVLNHLLKIILWENYSWESVWLAQGHQASEQLKQVHGAPQPECHSTLPAHKQPVSAGGSLVSWGQWTAVAWLRVCHSSITQDLQNPGKVDGGCQVVFGPTGSCSNCHFRNRGGEHYVFPNCPQTPLKHFYNAVQQRSILETHVLGH